MVTLLAGGIVFSGTQANATESTESGDSIDQEYQQSAVPAAANTAAASNATVRIGSSVSESLLLAKNGYSIKVGAALFDAADVAACDVLGNANWTITNYQIDRFTHPSGQEWIKSGKIALLCGTDKSSGFKHIRARHQYSTAAHPVSWERIREDAIELGANPAITWDDYMTHAVQDALDWPIHPAPYNQSDGTKACFSTFWAIWVDNVPVKTYYVNAVISVNNRRVITAYPSDNNLTSGCTGA